MMRFSVTLESNSNVRDITFNLVEVLILHEILRVISRFPRYISRYIAENRFPLGQCILLSRDSLEACSKQSIFTQTMHSLHCQTILLIELVAVDIHLNLQIFQDIRVNLFQLGTGVN